MTTPLPAARPSALTTSGYPSSPRASGGERRVCGVADAEARGRHPCRAMKSFANDLARLERRRLRGSGPHDRELGGEEIDDAEAERQFRADDREVDASRVGDRQQAPADSATSAGTHRARPAMPGLPGAQTTSDTSRSRASFQASACSRARRRRPESSWSQAK